MLHSVTNYQTSFRVEDLEGASYEGIQKIVFEWLGTKERDVAFTKKWSEFCLRGEWADLKKTRSSILTDTYISEDDKAWGLNYTHIDREYGARRFWHSEIGLRRVASETVVFIRISYSWNSEYLGGNQVSPEPSVPFFVRSILNSFPIYSGRKEFRLIEKPVLFKEVGQGQGLCDYITSPARRYPLVVFNGDSPTLISEAKKLSLQLTGKVQVAVIAENPDLAEEIRHCIPKEFRVGHGMMRVFFPFSQRFNAVSRHRWYDVNGPEYKEQRAGIISGLLRNNALLEPNAVESLVEVRQLISRSKLMSLRDLRAEQTAEMTEFYSLFDEVEKQRDDYKTQSEHFAVEVDSLEEEARQLKWKTDQLEARLRSAIFDPVDVAFLLTKLPEDLLSVVEAAKKFFPKLVITDSAVRSAELNSECECITEAWEIFSQLNNVLHPMKFNSEESQDLEAKFGSVSRYKLGMSEGKNTKRDSALMALREISYEGKTYDITPHIKHGNRPPKMLRIHFAFDEDLQKLVIGFVGSHLENATSRKV